MNEKLVIVPRMKTAGRKVMILVLFAVVCVLLLLAIFLSTVIFFIPALIVTGIWVWQGFYNNIEYEYTYYDGELRMAKITNKSKRKNLAEVNMEDVIAIAPKGDRSIYKYETDKNLKCREFTSGNISAKVYEVICKTEKGMCRYEFEPDEEMLDAIRVKYPRTVVK